MKKVYLDNNATTPIHPEVKKAMLEAMELHGNPSSMHEYGREANEAIEHARQVIADFIGAEKEEIIFTGSGSEGNNTVINSIFCHTTDCQNKNCHAKCHGKNHIVTSGIEHPCILETSRCFEKRGSDVTYLPVDKDGIVKIDELEKAINHKTGLVSIMMANNEIGTIQPIKEIAEIAKKHSVYVHTDAVQALGKIKVDVNELGVDFMTLSGHKVYAPKGIGVLYIRKGAKICPLIVGGHQEGSRRAGTENTVGIVAFGKAVEMLQKEMEENNKRIEKLRNKLRDGLLEKIPDIIINGTQDKVVPNTLNVTFKYVEGESILLYMDMEGIAVSTGSACSTGSLDPSHVIMALKVPVEYAHGSIRFSVGRENTEEDIDYVIEKMPAIIEKLRSMSPLS